MAFLLRVLPWGIAFLFTACSPVGPDYQPPRPDLPAQWSERERATHSADEATLHRWWTLFQDPTLNSLMTRAIDANLDLRRAESRIREARAQRRLTEAGGLPNLAVGGSYTNSRRSEHSASSSSSSGTQELFQADFDAGWELDIFGGIRRQMEAADANVAATVEDQRDVLVTLEAELARNYLELRASQQRQVIARENIRIQEQTVDLVRNKFQIGLGGELEVVQAETQLSLTKAQVPALESASILAMHQLALLLGQQPHTLKTELAKNAVIPPTPPQLPVTLPSDLLRRRPDIRAAERQLAAATATVGAATADLFPRFSLSALIGLQSTSISDLIASSSRFWSAGPRVQWPLFDGGRARATLEISEARRDSARITYEKTVLAALAEAENALVAFDREQITRTLFAEAVISSQRAVVIARGQYKAGITTFLNVLQSENTLYQSQDKLAQSNQQLAVNLVALYKALGGGWQARIDTTTAPLSSLGSNTTHRARNTP
jgi:NodT family efflux transporter outer membrane factor (OMF) lipoprotein